MLDEDINNPFFSTQLIGLDNYFDELINLYKSKKVPKSSITFWSEGSWEIYTRKSFFKLYFF